MQYSNVWEDFEFISSTKIHDHVISIASAGDNILNILALKKDFHPVIDAVDMDAAQLDCLKLTIHSIKTMDRETFLNFIGYSSPGGYKTTGRLEKFFDAFRKHAAECNYDKDKCKKAFQKLFSTGRDPSKLKHVLFDIEEISERMYERFMNSDSNEYTQMLKNPKRSIIPYVRYMTDDGYEIVKHNLLTYTDRIKFIHSDLQNHIKTLPVRAYTFILSDIFEYMSQDETDILFNDLYRISDSGSNIIYWCMLVERGTKNTFWKDITNDPFNDRIFFYRSRHICVK